jgi:hypothetical protein
VVWLKATGPTSFRATSTALASRTCCCSAVEVAHTSDGQKTPRRRPVPATGRHPSRYLASRHAGMPGIGRGEDGGQDGVLEHPHRVHQNGRTLSHVVHRLCRVPKFVHRPPCKSRALGEHCAPSPTSRPSYGVSIAFPPERAARTRTTGRRGEVHTTSKDE